MDRSPVQALWVYLLALIWVVCFALSLRHVASPVAIPSVYVVAGAGAHGAPVVASLTPEAEGSGIRTGDRLLALGDTSLRGADRLDYFVRFVEAAGSEHVVSVLYEREGERRRTRLTGDSQAATRALLPASLVFALAALALFLRARRTPTVVTLSLALLSTAIYLSANFFGGHGETVAALWVHAASLTLSAPLYCRALIAFPDDDLPPSRLVRAAPWLFALLGPLHMSRYGFGLPRQVGVPLVVVGVVLYLATLMLILTRNYRRSDPIGRRRMRWVLLGTYLAGAPAIVVGALASVDPRFTDAYIASLGALAIAPLAILVSVIRFNLFDVDRLISVAATYNLLLVGAVALGLLLLPRAGETVSGLMGLSPGFGHGVVATTLAVMVVLLAPRVRPWIDRIFFRERFALDRGFETLLDEVAASENASELTERLGESLWSLLHPELCVVYGRGEHAFRPLFSRGRAVPAALPAEGRLATLLESRSGPLALGFSRRWSGQPDVARFDRAALQALDAALVAPIRRGGRLVAMLCLGPKQSGDVYTPADARLIGALADRASAELERFDQDQILRDARGMVTSMRRYVPGAVAEALTRGADIESGEREVSVLFVDIRGYTRYVEDLEPGEIFGTVNRYTELVSTIIREHGGSVVEFNGDGMMAVFGAPEPLARKESCALDAARKIVVRVPELMKTPPDGEREHPALSVGVGIATGSAFVGNIRAADRWIWSAVGNTTNRAARFQSLTRDIDAAIVIDAATREAAAASDFVLHADRPIRGRSDEDVYSLPLCPTPR